MEYSATRFDLAETMVSMSDESDMDYSDSDETESPEELEEEPESQASNKPSRYLYRENPLMMNEILCKVFSFCTGSSIRNCRLVNHKWYYLSSSKLPDKDDIYVKLNTRNRVREYDVFTNKGYTWLPCHNFQINSELLSLIEFQDVFSYRGEYIRRLVITNIPQSMGKGSDTEDTMIKSVQLYWFLFHDIPQVEYLEIDCPHRILETSRFTQCWEYMDRNSPHETQLSRLKELKLSVPSSFQYLYTHFVCGVAKVAKNLEELSGILTLATINGVGIIRGLIDLGKVSIIKQMDLSPCHESYAEDVMLLKQFAQAQPKLRVMHNMRFQFKSLSNGHLCMRRQVEEHLETIILSSASTLESTSIMTTGFQQLFQLSTTMPKLHQLEIVFDSDGKGFEELQQGFLPISRNTFPKLEEVSIVWEENLKIDYAFGAILGFRQYPSIPSVKCLALNHVSSSGNFLLYLAALFPNVKELCVNSLHNEDNLQHFCRQLFASFPRVEKIQMNEIYDEKLRLGDVAYLDSCFTGMPEQVCRNLLLHLRRGLEVPPLMSRSLNLIRQFPSIVQLEKLQSFILNLGQDNGYTKINDLEQKRQFISEVTESYAFLPSTVPNPDQTPVFKLQMSSAPCKQPLETNWIH